MIRKRPLGVTLIGYFYVFGAIVILITLFTNAINQFRIAVRFGLPNVPENIMRVFVSLISLTMAYGYLKLEKWGYWVMLIYTIYFLVVSINVSQQYNQQPFYGNVIFSIIVFLYTISKRKYFNKENYVL
ncbi:hypothetical protein GCM10008904_31140 [Paraclostridium ghonii]|uniref:Uncharacterized protein n=1 Tax=Paraclostridium ghonii TaxID=29358 RepID=A0ABU0MXZ6_9FIRM|nr:hypothetical protein [Paeniclostridium ghonii]MDQ0555484.1 hypothetical protein [Paeniclostridium ghonii]